jgi:hypothetical protein
VRRDLGLVQPFRRPRPAPPAAGLGGALVGPADLLGGRRVALRAEVRPCERRAETQGQGEADDGRSERLRPTHRSTPDVWWGWDAAADRLALVRRRPFVTEKQVGGAEKIVGAAGLPPGIRRSGGR